MRMSRDRYQNTASSEAERRSEKEVAELCYPATRLRLRGAVRLSRNPAAVHSKSLAVCGMLYGDKPNQNKGIKPLTSLP
jgi:hypothetical protein